MHTIKCDFVAVVLSVDCALGQTVADGDIVLMLESMKMEIPVYADRDGVVAEILVGPGVSVSEGDVLVALS